MTMAKPTHRPTSAAGFFAVESAIDDLVTVRDWLRFGVSRFEAAGLVYGHGTRSALDESAFLILATLNLPIDRLDPWLEARLLRDERMRIFDVFEKRVLTRKPAAYLIGAAWIQEYRFAIDERVIVPRSFIGELILCDGLLAVIAEPDAIRRVADICTGSGCLGILAALAYPGAEVDAVDISSDALDVAARNVVDYRLEHRVQLVRSDLFSELAGRRYDLVISNPPYVRTAAVAAFPPEYQAEPTLAHLGGDDGLDVVRRILADVPHYLTANGVLVMEVGQERATLEAAFPDLPFLWLDTAESNGEVFALTASDIAPKPAIQRKSRSTPRNRAARGT